ncbi:hypothetical protein [Syntrophomonas palmitatica]|uniref:hypothetical protein n=1 Tax=Syntrophomonas palmitatica TaxID=402877 RepID=UPI0006CFBC42|nr:hypothetical protein [Syntrophomonas palmitatica]
MFKIEEKMWASQNLLDIELSFQEVNEMVLEMKIPPMGLPVDVEAFDTVSIKFPQADLSGFVFECERIADSIDDFLDVSRLVMTNQTPFKSYYAESQNHRDIDAFDNISLLSNVFIPALEFNELWYKDINPVDFWGAEYLPAGIIKRQFMNQLTNPEDIDSFDNVSFPIQDVVIVDNTKTGWNKIIDEIELHASHNIFEDNAADIQPTAKDNLLRNGVSLVKGKNPDVNLKTVFNKLDKQPDNFDIFAFNEAYETSSAKMEYEIPLRLTFEHGDMVFRLDLASVGISDPHKLRSSRAFSKTIAKLPRSIKGKHFHASLEDQELRLVVPGNHKKAQ